MTIELDIDYIDVYNRYDRSFTKASRSVGLSVATFRNKYLKQQKDDKRIGQYQDANQSLKAKLQRSQDLSRDERKNWRNDTRVTNALAEVYGELTEIVKDMVPTEIPEHVVSLDGNTGIIQLSDLHLAEVIDLPHNKYNLDIASQRLRKHVTESLALFGTQDVDNIILAITGDIVNQAIRPDKLLSNAVNFARSIAIAFDLLRGVIKEVGEDYPLQVVSCYSNEDRFDKDIGYIDPIASNTVGVAVHNLLKIHFEGQPVEFIEEGMEVIVNAGGYNVLFAHGHTFSGKDMEVSSSKVRAKHAAAGTLVDYVICGHIHSASVSTGYARSGGLPGDNAYSNYALSACGRSSQNCYVFGPRKRMSIVNDLQEVEGVVGYNYIGQ